MITLGDYGSYTYNAGCRNDDKGTAKIGSTQTTQITFDYKDFNAVETPAVERPASVKRLPRALATEMQFDSGLYLRSGLYGR